MWWVILDGVWWDVLVECAEMFWWSLGEMFCSVARCFGVVIMFVCPYTVIQNHVWMHWFPNHLHARGGSIAKSSSCVIIMITLVDDICYGVVLSVGVAQAICHEQREVAFVKSSLPLSGHLLSGQGAWHYTDTVMCALNNKPERRPQCKITTPLTNQK